MHIPKTGGSGIKRYLRDVPFTRTIDGDMHKPLIKWPLTMKNYDFFAFIRNPYTRFFSAYEQINRQILTMDPEVGRHEKISELSFYLESGKELTINQFIEYVIRINWNSFSMSQTKMINVGKTPTREVNYVLKYEEYEKNVMFMFKKLGIYSNITIQKHNRNPKTSRTTSSDEYYFNKYKNVSSLDFILEFYKDDFENYDYNKNFKRI